MREPFIFCAIDTDDLGHAISLAKSIGPITKGLKLGLEFFSAHGAEGVEKICKTCPDAALFLDLKFHDIPNTVAAAVRTVSRRFRPAYINVHAAGGPEMMHAAKAACAPGTKLLAVTVLTSLPDNTNVQNLAQLAKDSELDGVVCSAHETEKLRKIFGPDFILMVPGIRPAGSESHDQKRIMTPHQAMEKGATHLVMGRPLTGAPDPAAVARAILSELQ